MKQIKNTLMVLSFILMFSVTFVACSTKATLKLSVSENLTSVKPGETLQFETKLITKNKDLQASNITYSITNGSEYGTIDNTGLLEVLPTATVGKVITVISSLDNFKSNAIDISIAPIKATAIEISSNKETVQSGQTVKLFYTITPENSTSAVKWSILEGKEHATIVDDYLLADEGALPGTKITVQATVDGHKSNELIVTVAAAPETQKQIIFKNESITLDKYNEGSLSRLEVRVIGSNGQEITDADIEFAIETGDEYITLSTTGYSAQLEVIGHGQATVSATIKGTNVVAEATIMAILPPSELGYTGVFKEKANVIYSYSKVETLDYSLSPQGNNVAQDITYTFKKDGQEGEFATYDYDTGKIKFNETGLITVIGTSNSGSRKEATKSITFDINEGVNVRTFAELEEELEEKLEKDSKAKLINIVSDMIVEGTFENSNKAKARISVTKDFEKVTINGNEHTIDASSAKAKSGSLGNLIDFNPENATNLYDSNDKFDESSKNKPAKVYNVNINHLKFKGGASVESENNSYEQAIQIGAHKKKALYYVELSHLDISGFGTGIRVAHAVNSIVKDTKVENIYSNGIESNASIITFENMTYGMCGAAGIEITPESNTLAGENFNENQKVTFKGTITANNLNDGDTKYLAGKTFTKKIILSLFLNDQEEEESGYRAGTQNVLQNGKFIFVALIFNDIGTINESDLNYGNLDQYGIVNIDEMEEFDNTHMYVIIKDAKIHHPALGGVVNVGRILLYNQNYGKPNPANN